MMVTHRAVVNRAKIDAIKTQLFYGEISLEVAKERIQPMVNEINAEGRRLAEKHRVRFSPINANSLLR